ncbi:ROK family protein [Gryllotalpicola reticulitermitis]|uniref:ROK family protein n=1 Tax=Gryllotalpicola reticulitermitis TaxID=1184153 RepID=A0ABV8Q3Y1_9MICO
MSAPATNVIAGVDIGGTATQVVLCTPQLEIIGRATTPTPRGGDAMIDAAVGMIAGLVAEHDTELLGVGVGAAGVVDSVAGEVLVASDTFVDWAGYRVAAELRRRVGVPAFLENDVNAFLTGETAAGAITGATDALAIMIGTGVGGALWVDGRLFSGPHGAAGEIGHMPGFGDAVCSCGRHGHLESVAAGRQIALRYREAGGDELRSAEIARRAEAGEPRAAAVFRTAGRAVGQAISAVSALVDVTTVVVGGGVSNAWGLLAPAIDGYLSDEPPVSGLPIRIERSTLGKDAVAVGAASRVRTELGL